MNRGVRSMAVQNKEVTWKVLGIPVYGTITAPTNLEVHSAVVMVAGSGPTDRNWCSPLLPGENGSGKLLAETLASHGFVTLRYDKLASGPHARENLPRFLGKLSMQSHVEELAGAVETVLSETNYPSHGLFVLTNSEGAIHAVNYQLHSESNPFKGLVLTGAPGRAIGDVARSQILTQVRSLPDAQSIMRRYDQAITAFQASEPIIIDPSLPEVMKQLLLGLETPANLPFAKELWKYSLPDHLAKVTEPILVVIGKRDLQIDWKIDGQALQNATKQKTSVSFVYPEHANHVLKHDETSADKLTAQQASLRYNAPDAQLDKEATDAILDWLGKLSHEP